MGWFFFGLCLFRLWLAWNTWFPFPWPATLGVFSFFTGWPVSELAPHVIVLQLLVSLGFVGAGVLSLWQGVWGLALTLLGWAILLASYWRSRRARDVMEQTLNKGLGEEYQRWNQEEFPHQQHEAPSFYKMIALPFSRHYRTIEGVKDIVYHSCEGKDLRLDIYRHRSRPERCPTLLQVHGGGWIVGSKDEQGLPLMARMAARGWVCVSAGYRLSPRATWPDPIHDLKHAVAWIRQQGPEYGVDPDFVLVTGGSAGGHLASLLALTGNVERFQPGLEGQDTSLQGCVPFYGVYDFVDEKKLWPHRGLQLLLRLFVIKRSLEKAPQIYRDASPVTHIGPDSPPFLIVQGDTDTMVPPKTARSFANKLKQTSSNLALYAQIPGAQHAFDIFLSWRCLLTLEGVERYLAWLYHLYQRQQKSKAP